MSKTVLRNRGRRFSTRVRHADLLVFFEACEGEVGVSAAGSSTGMALPA